MIVESIVNFIKSRKTMKYNIFLFIFLYKASESTFRELLQFLTSMPISTSTRVHQEVNKVVRSLQSFKKKFYVFMTRHTSQQNRVLNFL